MGFGMLFGGLASGLAGGIEKAEQFKRQREMLDIQKKRLDLDVRSQELKDDELRRKIVDAARYEQAGEDYVNAKQMEFNQPEGVEGPKLPDGSFVSPQASQSALARLVIQAKQPWRLLENQQGQQDRPVNSLGALLARQLQGQPGVGPQEIYKAAEQMRAPPQPPRDIANRRYGETLPTLGHEKALQEATDVRNKLNRGGAAGSQQGQLDVRQTPGYLGNVGDISNRRAAETVVGKEGAELTMPLREKALNYINPNDLTTAAPTMTEGDALRAGYRAFAGKNAGQFITMSRSAINILDRMEQLVNKLFMEGKGAGVAAQNWAKIKQGVINRDPDAVEFMALRESNLAQFAKAAGDAANIAVPEQEFQKKALPGEYDTKESALNLLRSKRDIMRGVLEGALGMKPIRGSEQAPTPSQTPAPSRKLRFNPTTGKIEE